MNQSNTMSVASKANPELCSWIEKSLNRTFKSYEISVTGKSEKGDGYVGDIVFVTINGITSEQDEKILHWVVKHSKKNDYLRKSAPIKEAFYNEIYLYDVVFPAFRKIESEKNVLNGFESVPKCYNTLILDNMEVVMLDDIKYHGYELHDRKKPLNEYHLKVVLKEYGKLHALSFALRDQKSEEFEKLATFNTDIFKTFVSTNKSSVRNSFNKALSMLREKNDLRLVEKLEELIKNDDPADIYLDLLTEREPQSAIIHGDSWNNNFMFKYQNDDKTSPTNVCILDWQISTLRSPAFDLSYLIYSTGSTHEFDKFDELLQFYYDSFANFLKELGGNPEEVFPYSSLRAHWRKYSLNGLVLALMVLPMALCDKEEAPSFEDLKAGEQFSDLMLLDIKDSELYYKRIKPIINFHFKNTI